MMIDFDGHIDTNEYPQSDNKTSPTENLTYRMIKADYPEDFEKRINEADLDGYEISGIQPLGKFNYKYVILMIQKTEIKKKGF